MTTELIMTIVGVTAPVALTLIGVYVNLSNQINIHRIRIEKLESVVDGHEEKLERKFDELLKGFHRLELLIENLKHNEK
jgi:hypothetical protein